MLDMARERMRHLVANAVLELWKKETGSLTPVVIEGTICITTASGRTTVIQVSDRFACPIPDLQRNENNNYDQKLQGKSARAPSVDTHSSAQAMAAYLDDLSPASLVSPPADTSVAMGNHDSRPSSRTSHQHNSHNSFSQDSRVHDSGIELSTSRRDHSNDYTHHSNDLSVSKFKDESVSEEGEEESRDSLNDSRGSTGAGPVCAGTGYYTLDGKHKLSDERTDDEHVESTNETSGMDTTEEFSVSDSNVVGPLMSTPKSYILRENRDFNHEASMDDNRDDVPKSSALDLSGVKRDADDLALSPPHSYTVQVRDVIRQRLLAQKFATNQLKIAASPLNDSIHDNGSELNSPVTSLPSKNGSLSSESKDSSPGDSLPPALLSPFPGAPLLSPEANPMLVFPFSPFAQRNNLLYAGHIQELMQRTMAAGLVPPPPSPKTTERPASEPTSTLTPPTPEIFPSTPDMLSLSFDGRRTPQTSNSSNSSSSASEQKVYYKCEFCEKTFLFKSKYQEHLPVHTNARPYQCRLCARTYKYKYDLRVHLRTHLGIPTKSTLCPFCNAKFDSNKLLRQHIKESHREHHTTLTEEQVQMFDAI